MQNAKQAIQGMLNSMPDDCTIEEISYRLELHRRMERSADDIANGRVHSAEEAKEIVRSWDTSSGQTKL